MTSAAARRIRRAGKAVQACVDKSSPPPLSISCPNMLAGGLDHEFRRLIHRLLIISGRLEAVRDVIARAAGVTGVQYSMLMPVLYQGGEAGVSISALADYLQVTGSHVTSEIGKLAMAGLVSKAVNPRDARGVVVQITNKGRERLLAAYPLIRGINDRLFENISPAEFAALQSFSEKFVKNTKTALQWGESNSSESEQRFHRPKLDI